MATHIPPQPSPERMVPFAGHSVLVGVTPEPAPLLVRTALAYGASVAAPAVHFAYVDPERSVVEEHEDGSVVHVSMNPDAADDAWQGVAQRLEDHLGGYADPGLPPIRFWYLAGRPDRSLTHLARAVDASTIIVGTRRHVGVDRLNALVNGSLALHLMHHQHRPVLTVPLAVVDWKELPWQD